jgi:NCAIR mutase (PurE)-related protein
MVSSAKGYCDLGFAKLDTDRLRRRGFPEVIYAPGKERAQLKGIIRKLAAFGQQVLLTKLEKSGFLYLKKSFPRLKYSPQAKMAYFPARQKLLKGRALVISAGTSDMPVAEEATLTLEAMGNRVQRLYDVGVAGVHRLMHNVGLLRQAKVIVVVAGMEGALASLVSGLVSCPVIAVPTSCGYGASFAGLSALLTMLNSCSPGIAVVNIDNGFGAGYFASLVNK